MLLRCARWAIIAGVVLTLGGLVVGFGLLFSGRETEASPFLASIPFGFLIAFTGLVVELLHASRD